MENVKAFQEGTIWRIHLQNPHKNIFQKSQFSGKRQKKPNRKCMEFHCIRMRLTTWFIMKFQEGFTRFITQTIAYSIFRRDLEFTIRC